MNQKTAKLLRKITRLTAHTRPGTPRKQYHQLKAAWLETPKNRRGSTSAGLKANVIELQARSALERGTAMHKAAEVSSGAVTAI